MVAEPILCYVYKIYSLIPRLSPLRAYVDFLTFALYAGSKVNYACVEEREPGDEAIKNIVHCMSVFQLVSYMKIRLPIRTSCNSR